MKGDSFFIKTRYVKDVVIWSLQVRVGNKNASLIQIIKLMVGPALLVMLYIYNLDGWTYHSTSGGKKIRSMYFRKSHHVLHFKIMG